MKRLHQYNLTNNGMWDIIIICQFLHAFPISFLFSLSTVNMRSIFPLNGPAQNIPFPSGDGLRNHRLK